MPEGIEQAPGACGCVGGGTCNVTICANGCAGLKVPGASVTVKTGGGVIVATGTTNGVGCVTLNVLSAGTYTVLITKTGFANYTTSQAVTCGSTYTYTLTPADGYFCAGTCGCPSTSPTSVTLNDGFGDIVCTTGTIFGTWGGCAMRPATGWFLTNACTFFGDGDPHLLTQDIPIWFGVGCNETGGMFLGLYIAACLTFGFRYNYRDGCDCSNPTGDFGVTLDCSGTGAGGSSTFSCDPFIGTVTLNCPGPNSTSGNPPKVFDVYGSTALFTLTP